MVCDSRRRTAVDVVSGYLSGKTPAEVKAAIECVAAEITRLHLTYDEAIQLGDRLREKAGLTERTGQ